MATDPNNQQKRLWIAQLRRWLPLLVIVLMLFIFFGTGLHHYLSFEELKAHKSLLEAWTNTHFFGSVLAFIFIYSLSVAISVPGAVFLTLAGGFLFGPYLGSFLVVFSATLGATILFLAVKTSFGAWFARRATGWVSRMRTGFQKNAFFYLLSLRLVPLFPFWVVNIVPALLGVNVGIYMIATFLGIIPGSVVYVLIGSGLNHIFATNQTPNLGIILDPKLLYPLLALSCLSLLPVIFQKWFKKKDIHNE